MEDNQHTTSGAAAETYARRFLKSQGLRIIGTNYRTTRGELDIIAKDGDTVVFVEVRLRNRPQFGAASETIDHRKQQRLIYAASHFLQHKGLWDKVNCRFDAVCLSDAAPNNNRKTDKKTPYQVEWIRNAFTTF